MKIKHAGMKGRKRFLADLDEIRTACRQGLCLSGLRVTRLQPSEDEGTFEFTVLHGAEHVVTINLLISETAEYPSEHAFFAFSPDKDLPPRVSHVVEGISERGSNLICVTVQDILNNLSRAIGIEQAALKEGDSDADELEDDDEDEEYLYDDDDQFGISSGPTVSSFSLDHLQRDFIEVVGIGSDYRPGLIRFNLDDVAITISRPVISLAKDIPPRALMAWDRRLLSSMQHLTLLIHGVRGVYPVLQPDGMYTRDALVKGAKPKFHVGLTARYKPGTTQVRELTRHFGLVQQDDDNDDDDEQMEDDFLVEDGNAIDTADVIPEPEEEDIGRFDKFSLSTAMESLLNEVFLHVVQLRIRFKLGWAAAELLRSEAEKKQRKPEEMYEVMKDDLINADWEERRLGNSYRLPYDPLTHTEKGADINLPLLAFSYLIRRLTLCARYCLVCHDPIKSDYEALKPYVCDNKLCTYQYYHMSLGTSLEYEICANPAVVDLLLSLTYCAAAEGVLDDPLPVGMGLRVPPPMAGVSTSNRQIIAVHAGSAVSPPKADGPDGLCDFDVMDIACKRAAIRNLIDTLPPIADVKRYLEKKVKDGKSKPKLQQYDPSILPAAWAILRWCVASCTAHLEELTSEEEIVQNIDSSWRQFRFTVGSPDAEAKFSSALRQAQKENSSAKAYPSIYAFHGSPLRNWHSIIRHGLWFKDVANGRAYGHGVYFAKDGRVSMNTYSVNASYTWRNSASLPTKATALAEIVNHPSKFVSTTPYLVVAQTEWIACRYLLIKSSGAVPVTPKPDDAPTVHTPFVRSDPSHSLTMGSAPIKIPLPSHHIERLISLRRAEVYDENYDDEDTAVFEGPKPQVYSQSKDDDADEDEDAYMDDDDYEIPASPTSKGKQKESLAAPLADDWVHDPEWVNASIAHLMPPPVDATPMATMALQKELKAMLNEQKKAKSLKELGWYMPPDLIGDNLFQWIVELHSFEKDLPIAKDMKNKGLNSLIFEIRFPPSYPHSPPFFRIIKPRFLPFIQGGGGHVTGGGSMCMDLLTTDGWLPSYSISAVLLQIKLAISNLDPRPARLANDWDRPYGVQEALEGYKRAAGAHGWTLPAGIDKLVR
ncbi:hypothetical protein PUNSTDRAFT_115057 [Punctularia strigosozonata HHB-11173 SS5]|uniref:uncharacterized protein n=1 Tax=Punctularia strigosozonata (strain HHB-11173) TaxID=741275 RepID=UPI000441860D|nr:uncharacterized protein PUNSTDRAFT_115057 [Punctularia strigosozonata HHB-11173 SS5]EIN06501.1 hypothetical protein PUNSTDRAFT_115057 [Punctularia strigosozonata HHB-11173 SS5]